MAQIPTVKSTAFRKNHMLFFYIPVPLQKKNQLYNYLKFGQVIPHHRHFYNSTKFLIMFFSCWKSCSHFFFQYGTMKHPFFLYSQPNQVGVDFLWNDPTRSGQFWDCEMDSQTTLSGIDTASSPPNLSNLIACQFSTQNSCL